MINEQDNTKKAKCEHTFAGNFCTLCGVIQMDNVRQLL
jgi:hypothetical protein